MHIAMQEAALDYWIAGSMQAMLMPQETLQRRIVNQ